MSRDVVFSLWLSGGMGMRGLLMTTAIAGAMAVATPALAVDLLGGMTGIGLGGPEGYGLLSQGPNDDQSSSLLGIGFSVNFFGATYNSLYVNNNGNVSFGNPLSAFTPDPFGQGNIRTPMIAPYWGDVDTRASNGGHVYYSATANQFVATWHNVGYYDTQSNKLNDFQLVLTRRNDTDQVDQLAGNFDIEFRYNRLEWTTGSASGGSNGLGGIPAQAGYDAGRVIDPNGDNAFTLPGSRTGDVLDLVDSSNTGTDGLWRFSIRNGEIANGNSPLRPLDPIFVNENGGFEFDCSVGNAAQPCFIDPLVATGYDYSTASSSFTSVVLPTLLNEDGYQITTVNGTVLGSAFSVANGGTFDFLSSDFTSIFGNPVTSFGVRGIDAGLDPTDTTAFVTGLAFADAGTHRVVQTPFVENITTALPEPATWGMMLIGFGALGTAMRRRTKAVALTA